MRRIPRLALVLALGATLPGSAHAGTVRGVVVRQPATAEQPAAVSRYREHSAASHDDAEQPTAGCQCNPGLYAVVHLTGDNLPPPRLPVAPPAMAQKDRTFVPSVLAIPVGGAVSFPNEDPFFHNVFSYAKPRSFDLGRYPAGETHDVVFDKAGVVPVFCEIHYSMRAYIHVMDTPYFAVTDEGRHFEIADVAPGEYVLHVWQENLPEITMPVVVGNEPLDLQVR